jgi:hypothetical protein
VFVSNVGVGREESKMPKLIRKKELRAILQPGEGERLGCKYRYGLRPTKNIQSMKNP